MLMKLSFCCSTEMLTGSRLFAGESSIDQLVEIVEVLGPPTLQDIKDMNIDEEASRPIVKTLINSTKNITR